MQNVSIIGGGFSGITAAAYAAKAGYSVAVFEKNNTLGGRARQWHTGKGYVFDMGPSWYWMPEVFEGFFADFGKSALDYYVLKKLDPQFEIVFSDGKLMLPGAIQEWKSVFNALEPGAGEKLSHILEDAERKYRIAIPNFVEKPCRSLTEFLSPTLIKSAVQLQLFTSMRKLVKNHFRHPWLRCLMEFPVLFLGASPANIPAMYNLMNFGGYQQGTFYPIGGFGKVVDAMVKVAQEQGVQFYTGCEVTNMAVQNKRIHTLETPEKHVVTDAVIAAADYQFTEQLIPEAYRNYSESYWKKRTFAPSCLLFYIGLKEKLPGLQHHTLFFESDLDQHLSEIYQEKKWPTHPLFYVCCPSKTDSTIAPKGHENLFLLMPIATGLEDTEDLRQKYLDSMVARIEKHCRTTGLKNNIEVLKSYCINDFIQDYHAYGGNAYGLANTLRQTALLKPKMHNKKIANLLYTGQLTIPGPGVPPAILSGKIAAHQLCQLNL